MKHKSLDFNLYLITDRKLITRFSSLVTAVKEALEGGVRAVQLREKDLETRQLLKLAYNIRELTDKYDAKLFINDRYDIALAVCADGVHLTQNSIPVAAVRKVVKKKLFIGVSTHSLKEAKEAEKGGADFLTLGPVYRTQSKFKYGPPIGIENFKKISSKIGIPVFALGGVKSKKIGALKEAGAGGVAMISEILSAGDIKGKTEEIINMLHDN